MGPPGRDQWWLVSARGSARDLRHPGRPYDLRHPDRADDTASTRRARRIGDRRPDAHPVDDQAPSGHQVHRRHRAGRDRGEEQPRRLPGYVSRAGSPLLFIFVFKAYIHDVKADRPAHRRGRHRPVDRVAGVPVRIRPGRHHGAGAARRHQDLREQAHRHRALHDQGLGAERPLHCGAQPELLAQGQERRSTAVPRPDHLQADRRERADGERHPSRRSRPRARRRRAEHRAIPRPREAGQDQPHRVDQVPRAHVHDAERHEAAVQRHQPRASRSRTRSTGTRRTISGTRTSARS